jgi:hypothetical protein
VHLSVRPKLASVVSAPVPATDFIAIGNYLGVVTAQEVSVYVVVQNYRLFRVPY